MRVGFAGGIVAVLVLVLVIVFRVKIRQHQA